MSPPKIDGYRFGTITVDGTTYGKDLIIHEDGVIPNWRRLEGHKLNIDDLDKVMPLKPKVLLVGCGTPGLLVVPQATEQWLTDRGVEIVICSTDVAWERYNEMASKGGVVAAFHLTC